MVVVKTLHADVNFEALMLRTHVILNISYKTDSSVPHLQIASREVKHTPKERIGTRADSSFVTFTVNFLCSQKLLWVVSQMHWCVILF
jgi:hypothetical protein